MTRCETIDSIGSEDLVTVVEVAAKKPFKIVDPSRGNKKGVMAASLKDLLNKGEKLLGDGGRVPTL